MLLHLQLSHIICYGFIRIVCDIKKKVENYKIEK